MYILIFGFYKCLYIYLYFINPTVKFVELTLKKQVKIIKCVINVEKKEKKKDFIKRIIYNAYR